MVDQVYRDIGLFCAGCVVVGSIIAYLITKFSNWRDRIWLEKNKRLVDCVIQDRESCGLSPEDPIDAIITIPLKNLIYADVQGGKLFLQFRDVEQSNAKELVSCTEEFQRRVNELFEFPN